MPEMTAERLLDEARLRIAARKKEEIVIPGNPIEVPPSIAETPYKEIAEDRFIRNLPLSIRYLLGDIVSTIQKREKCTLVDQKSFDYSTNDTKKIAKLVEKHKNPIKSGIFSYEKTIIEKGAVHEREVFGPVSPYYEKSPDITYKIFFALSYNNKSKLVEWIMGDEEGPELDWEPEIKEKSYKLTTHNGHVKGSIIYSKANMLTLAEDLVTQIDLGRYKYQVREIPIMQLQQG